MVTGLGVGYLPWIPGTFGSLEAVLLVWGVREFVPGQDRLILAGFLVVAVPLGIFLSGRFSVSENETDPSRIVIDEILGQILCLLWVPVSTFSLVVGFVLFRFFDIAKPFPAGRSEKLPGGFGIVCDDLVAGVYAGLSLKLISVIIR